MVSQMLGMMVLLTASTPTQQMAEIHQDFRNSKYNDQIFRLEGKEPSKYVKKEERGLRINLPSEKGPKNPIGIVLRLDIRGDFAATVAYEILKADKPPKGYGYGLALYLMINSPTKDGVTLARLHSAKEGQVFSFTHMMADEKGKRQRKRFQTFPAKESITTGKFRMVREKETLALLVNEGGKTDYFKELGRFDLGLEEVNLLRIAADPGNSEQALDVRITDFRIQAQELIAPGMRASQTSSRRWVFWGVVIAIFLMVGAFFGYRWWARLGKAKHAKQKVQRRG